MSVNIVEAKDIEPAFYEHYGGLFPKGALSIIAGQGGSGKSTLLCYLAETLSSEAKTVIVSNEEDAGVIRSRLSAGSRVGIASFSTNLEHTKITKQDLLEIIGLYDLVLVDSLVTFNDNKDINKAGTAEAFLAPLVAKVVGTDKAVVLLHHTTKGGGETLQDMVSGSERLVSGVRQCRILINDKLHNRRFLGISKDNTGADWTNYEVISKAQFATSGSVVVGIERLVPTQEDMDKIVYMNSRAAKIKKWDKEMYASASDDKIEDPPVVIQRVLEKTRARATTPSGLKALGENEYKYFLSAISRSKEKWVQKKKEGRQVVYHFTELAQEWYALHYGEEILV